LRKLLAVCGQQRYIRPQVLILAIEPHFFGRLCPIRSKLSHLNSISCSGVR
jgi:hypothetical protein